MSQSSIQRSRDAEKVQKFERPLAIDTMVYLVLIFLTWMVWQVSRQNYFEAGDDVGYWLGVAGGVMMLLLFTYPLRKHFRFASGWGPRPSPCSRRAEMPLLPSATINRPRGAEARE